MNADFSLMVVLARTLCPCSERTAARGTGSMGAGAATLAIRPSIDGTFILRVECPQCGKSVEAPFNSALRLTVVGPPPGAHLLPLAATQLPGKA